MRYRHSIAAVLAAAVLGAALTGCGGSAKDDARPAPPPDKGPVCVGTAPDDGMHVLRGGDYPLPDGTGMDVTYAAGTADGTTRTATLTAGKPQAEKPTSTHTVHTGEEVTFQGHAYTVSQICTYRVVLEPRSPADRKAVAAEPSALTQTAAAGDKAALRTLCYSTHPAARAARIAGMPASGELTILQGRQISLVTGISVGGNNVGKQSATFTVTCAGGPVMAVYQHVRAGDTVEIGDVLYVVAPITSDGFVDLERQGG